ncbi:MAG: AMP-binding protein, partial [Chloroflexota bacterium]
MNASPGSRHPREVIEADTFQCLIALAAERFADLPAIAGLTGPPVTYRALGALVDAFRSDLRAHGIGPQDRVLFPAPQTAFGALLLLALQASAVAVPVREDVPAAELAALLPRLGLRAALLPRTSSRAGRPYRLAVAQAGIPALDADLRHGCRLLLAGAPAGPPAPDRDALPNDVALIFHTSGTTGRPKLVPLSQRSVADYPARCWSHMPVWPGDVTLVSPPIVFAFGQSSLSRSLASGGLAVLPYPQPAAVLSTLVASYRPAWLPISPLMLDHWLRGAGHAPIASGGRLRYLHLAGAFTPLPLREAAESRLAAQVLQGYGTSEALAAACHPLDTPRRPETAGVPVSPLRIVDEAGTPLPAGDAGLIQIGGPTVFAGYLDDPAATARALTPDHWFRTGDRGLLLPDGHLLLLGRADDVINHGGEKIDPYEVEAVLLAHPAVLE